MTTMSKNKAPKPGATGFALRISPTRKHLDKAIEADGFCDPRNCWHRMAIFHVMNEIDPGENHHIGVDAGHVKIHFQGWRYVADSPRHVKHSLMLFDMKKYGDVHIRAYTLRFRRTTKIVAIPRARQAQINAARKERVAAGILDRRNYPNLRKRVEGFSGIV